MGKENEFGKCVLEGCSPLGRSLRTLDRLVLDRRNLGQEEALCGGKVKMKVLRAGNSGAKRSTH